MDYSTFDNPHEIVTSSVPIFFFIWDVEERKVVYVSKKFYDLAGDTIPLQHEKDLKKYFDPAFHQKYDKFFDALSAKNDYTNKLEIKTSELISDTKVRWIEIRTFPVDDSIRDKNGETKLVVGHLVDITDRKEEIKILEGENQTFDNMMQMISHDLRQPFTKITLLAEMIQMQANGNKEIDNYAAKIKDVTNTAHQLLEHSLQLAALNYNDKIVSTTNENIGHIIRKAAHELDAEIEDKKLTFNLNIPEGEYIYPIDTSFFIQLLKNLFSNAIKFTPAGGTITVEMKTTSDAYEICVSDNGIGIPDEIKPKIFKEVAAVRRAGLDGQKSTGLGLAIAKRIAELHQGSIYFESEEGKGTAFTVILPLKPYHTRK